MSEEGRRAYRRFGTFFLLVGAAFLVLGVVRLAWLPDVLRGNPLPVAVLLLAIGVGLRQTVRRDEHLAAQREAQGTTGDDGPLDAEPEDDTPR